MARSSPRYPAELRDRAVRRFYEIRPDHPSDWLALMAVADELRINHQGDSGLEGGAQTVRRWVRKKEQEQGVTLPSRQYRTHPPELRELAVRRFYEIRPGLPSDAPAIKAVADELQVEARNVRLWVRKREKEQGVTRPSRPYPPELRELAVRRFYEIRPDHRSDWSAVMAVADELDFGPTRYDTPLRWIRVAQSAESKRWRRNTESVRLAFHVGVGADYQELGQQESILFLRQLIAAAETGRIHGEVLSVSSLAGLRLTCLSGGHHADIAMVYGIQHGEDGVCSVFAVGRADALDRLCEIAAARIKPFPLRLVPMLSLGVTADLDRLRNSAIATRGTKLTVEQNGHTAAYAAINLLAGGESGWGVDPLTGEHVTLPEVKIINQHDARVRIDYPDRSETFPRVDRVSYDLVTWINKHRNPRFDVLCRYPPQLTGAEFQTVEIHAIGEDLGNLYGNLPGRIQPKLTTEPAVARAAIEQAAQQDVGERHEWSPSRALAARSRSTTGDAPRPAKEPPNNVTPAISIREVAKRAGVSVGTVSNVLNRPNIVAEATRNRVKEVIEELGFVPNETARTLRRKTVHRDRHATDSQQETRRGPSR
jgi:transposase